MSNSLLEEAYDDEDTVKKAVARWRAASSAHVASYDPADEDKSALLSEMYVKALRALSNLRPATSAGLLLLARAVIEEIDNSGTADDADLDMQLLYAVAKGVLTASGP